MASNTVRVLNTVPPKTGLAVVREFTDGNRKKKENSYDTRDVEGGRGTGGRGRGFDHYVGRKGGEEGENKI